MQFQLLATIAFAFAALVAQAAPVQRLEDIAARGEEVSIFNQPISPALTIGRFGRLDKSTVALAGCMPASKRAYTIPMTLVPTLVCCRQRTFLHIVIHTLSHIILLVTAGL
ncbi:hypothetical protein C8R47DRAFT_1315710 [Mycena vitilis]|nr:hypothetical protein C8R47DRAFT_1315710 [Mycena vitilis]